MTLRTLKTTLIITFITLILLELSLRFISSSFLFLRNPINLSHNHEALRILTVGESTTAYGFSGSYPRQLEILLKEKLKREVQVINVSVPGTTTSELKKNLPLYIEEHKPHIITFMTGINDTSHRSKKNDSSFINNFVTYKLISEFFRKKETNTEISIAKIREESRKEASTFSTIELNPKILDHINRKLKSANFNTFEPTPFINKLNNNKIFDLLEEYLFLQKVRRNKDCQTLYKILKDIPNLTKNDNFVLPYFQASLGLGDIPSIRKASEQLALNSEINLQHITQKLHNHLNEVHSWKHWELTSHYYEKWMLSEKKTDKKVEVLKMHISFLTTTIESSPFNLNIENIKKRSLRVIEESRLSSHPEISSLKDRLLVAKKLSLGSQIIDQKQYYRVVGDDLTHENQRSMALLSIKAGAEVIIVQYPTLKITPLKKVYKGLPVHFVENHQNFNKIIASKGYSELFTDNFAGNFGHFTPEGHKLVAENIAQSIVDSFKK